MKRSRSEERCKVTPSIQDKPSLLPAAKRQRPEHFGCPSSLSLRTNPCSQFTVDGNCSQINHAQALRANTYCVMMAHNSPTSPHKMKQLNDTLCLDRMKHLIKRTIAFPFHHSNRRLFGTTCAHFLVVRFTETLMLSLVLYFFS